MDGDNFGVATRSGDLSVAEARLPLTDALGAAAQRWLGQQGDRFETSGLAIADLARVVGSGIATRPEETGWALGAEIAVALDDPLRDAWDGVPVRGSGLAPGAAGPVEIARVDGAVIGANRVPDSAEALLVTSSLLWRAGQQAWSSDLRRGGIFGEQAKRGRRGGGALLLRASRALQTFAGEVAARGFPASRVAPT